MKYVIEIEDRPTNSIATYPDLYRVKGFRALVFDEVGLKKLTPFDEAVNVEKNTAWNKGYDAGHKNGKAESYDKGYDEGYDVGVESGRDKGYIDGFEEGKEAMKEIVMKNLTKFVDGSKFKPEVAIFDACDDCRYAHKEAHEMPCVDCKHSHKDYYERG